MRPPHCLALLLVLWASSRSWAEDPKAELIATDKIWDEAPHNAFTDLIRWDDRFICAFREGRAHVSTDGQIRVLSSADGAAWESAAVVKLEGYDLRDAGLSIAPDGRLMLVGGASPRKADGKSAPTGTFVAFSEDAAAWTTPVVVVEPGRWLWRVTWHDGRAYGVSYSAGSQDRTTELLASNDGLRFEELVPRLLNKGRATEAVLRFGDEGKMICLQRRDDRPPRNTAMLGESAPPYDAWQWHDLKIYFGGPNFIALPDGRWIAAGRVVRDGVPKTELAWLDVDDKALRPFLELPSGGDTSYPGLVWHDERLWVSYYSSHEGKANIYLAKVRLE